MHQILRFRRYATLRIILSRDRIVRDGIMGN